MAKFEGTRNEFIEFIDSYSRNLISNYTRKLKLHTTCKNPNCNKRKKLQAAHITGRERRVIINEILDNYEIGNRIDINLNDFKALYIDMHLPIEKNIIILCPDCHQLYDSKTKKEVDYNKIKFDKKDLIEECNIRENKIEKESDKRQTRKKQLSKVLFEKLGKKINSTQISYSKVNKAKNVWWLEPSIEKSNNDLYFILDNDHPIFLKIPKNDSIYDNLNQRKKEKRFHIEIDVNSKDLQDVKSNSNFSKFIIKKS